MLDKTDLDVAGQQLLEIADYIEKHGWCQHAYSIGERVCILGAARKLFPDEDPDETQGVLKLQKLLDEPVVGWNDEDDRTKGQVIDKLREVAFTK